MKRPAATAVRRRPAVKAGAATASEPCRKRRCLLAPDAVAAAAEASECKAFQGRLDERGSEVSYRPDFVSASEAAAWLSELREKVPWEQGHVKLFGKMHPEPRLTCYYGDHGFQYTYSGRTVRPRPWDECPLVARIRRRVESATGERFNTATIPLAGMLTTRRCTERIRQLPLSASALFVTLISASMTTRMVAGSASG
eukprot:TRINITY_DN7403_c0_g1_i3.p1 TRINITY_DN7403_c0_g1~~TRINITY_DN7403_c0_g1_i3.p1  ORF type:complete len:206 (-),score=24.46 TRINITY_DN7403_c0_g1_i3:207-800(-)